VVVHGRALRFLTFAACLSLLHCDGRRPLVAPTSPGSLPSSKGSAPAGNVGRRTDSVVLVALDGVRWQEVFQGVERSRARDHGMSEREIVEAKDLVPNLHRLANVEGTALGAPDSCAQFVATGPDFLSLPGYTEMLSGHAPAPCADNECPATTKSTLVDQIREASAANASEVAVISSWERIERVASANPSEIVMSTGRTHGTSRARLRFDRRSSELLDQGAEADAWPGEDDFRPDRYTAAIALHYLASQRPRFLFLGLGDTDELAHANDYRGYLEAMRHADDVIGQLVTTLDEMGSRGFRTTLLVTADHGRSSDFKNHGRSAPESARVWLIAAGGGVVKKGTVSCWPRHLADIAPSIRALMRLPADRSPGAGHPIEELVPLLR
jgi:Metalloenzyme superfamily